MYSSGKTPYLLDKIMAEYESAKCSSNDLFI
jgi:hypothetical protein